MNHSCIKECPLKHTETSSLRHTLQAKGSLMFSKSSLICILNFFILLSASSTFFTQTIPSSKCCTLMWSVFFSSKCDENVMIISFSKGNRPFGYYRKHTCIVRVAKGLNTLDLD